MERKENDNNISENHYQTQSTTTLFKDEQEESKQSEDGLVQFIGDNWMNSIMAHRNHEKKGIT